MQSIQSRTADRSLGHTLSDLGGAIRRLDPFAHMAHITIIPYLLIVCTYILIASSQDSGPRLRVQAQALALALAQTDSQTQAYYLRD